VQPKPEPEPEVAKVQPPPPPPEQRRKQSITQKSDDPDVEPPPDAKYLAEESRRVEEETVASVTDEHHDDPDPKAAAPQAAGPEESGDAHRDEKGADKGAKDSEEKRMAAAERNQPSLPSPQQQPQPSQQEPNRPSRPSVREVAPQPEAPAPTVYHDPMGTFVLAPSNAGQAARRGQDAVAAANGRKIQVSWSAFEATFGAEQLAQDRLPKEAKRRGAGREKRWEEFRAAIENYIVGAKPGNSTALNAAADPFAAYLAAFHRNLHAEFAHEFLASLPALGELADTNLVTKVEIVVNPDGSLDRVGVVKSSGNMMYDFGAFNAVQRGAPYPPPPEKIRSPDGRVYIVWALRRDESQCGTWNAEPYILKNPPRSPKDPKPDNVSPYRPSTPGGGDPADAEHGRAPTKVPPTMLKAMTKRRRAFVG
jgi:TonB family protein